MNDDIIRIAKRDTARGEDGYKTFSVRIKEDTVAALDDLALKSNRSRNELINIILDFGVTLPLLRNKIITTDLLPQGGFLFEIRDDIYAIKGAYLYDL